MLWLRFFGVPVALSFWFFAVLAGFALADRGVLLWYLLLPVAVHECGHLLAMLLCRVGVREIRCTARGVEIRRGPVPGYGRELLICLAGPAANLLLALALHMLCFHSVRLMFLVASNIAVALFNLAPVGDLDGGQVAKLLASRFFSPDAARRLSAASSVAVLAVLFGCAIFLVSQGLANGSMLVACVFLALNILLHE